MAIKRYEFGVNIMLLMFYAVTGGLMLLSAYGAICYTWDPFWMARAGDWFIGLRALVHYLRELRRYTRGIATGNREETRMAWACLRWLPLGLLAGLRGGAPRPVGRAENE